MRRKERDTYSANNIIGTGIDGDKKKKKKKKENALFV